MKTRKVAQEMIVTTSFCGDKTENHLLESILEILYTMCTGGEGDSFPSSPRTSQNDKGDRIA